MAERSSDKSYTRGYSLPDSIHRLIDREAERRGMSKSMLVNQSFRFWCREHGVQLPPVGTEPAKKAS